MGEFSRQGMERTGATPGVTSPFISGGMQQVPRSSVGMGSSEITVPGQGNPEDQTADVLVTTERTHQRHTAVDRVGEAVARQAVQAAGMDPGAEPRRSARPVTPLVFLPPAMVESVVARSEPKPEPGKPPATEAAAPPETADTPTEAGTAEDEAHSEHADADIPEKRRARNQGYNVVRSALAAGVDVEGLIPKNSYTVQLRLVLRGVAEGATPAEIAEATGMNIGSVTRDCQRAMPYIQAYAGTYGMPEGLTPDMFVPQHVEQARPTGYAMEEVRQRLREKGITPKQLAAQYGGSVSRVSRMLDGIVHGEVTLAEVIINQAYDDPDEAAAKFREFVTARRRMYDARYRKDD